MVAAMTMTFAGMSCHCVCSWVCACAHAHVRKCGWLVPCWFLSFSVVVCMVVCESGGGLAWIDAWVKVSLCLSVYECVTAFFGFWLPRFVCVCGFVNVCTRRCVCVCVCQCVCVPRLERAQEDAGNQKSASSHVRTTCMCYPRHTSQ